MATFRSPQAMRSVVELSQGEMDLSSTGGDMDRTRDDLECSSLTCSDQPFKVTLLGPCNTGKTSLQHKMANQNWNFQKVRMTIGHDCKQRTMQIGDTHVKLQLIDTQGIERRASFTTSHYRQSHVMFFVFDLTDAASFSDIAALYNEAETYQRSPQVIKILLGNKSDDLAGQREVDYQTAQAFAYSTGMRYYETSAYNGHNVERLLMETCRSLKEQADAISRSRPISRLLFPEYCSPQRTSQGIQLAQDDEPRRRCC